MKIAEINNSVDILNLIPNVEEHYLEFVEELLQCSRTWINTATQWDSNVILTNWSPNLQLVDFVEGKNS